MVNICNNTIHEVPPELCVVDGKCRTNAELAPGQVRGVVCDDETVEDMQHFLIECKALEPCRVLFRTEAAAALLFAGGGAQCAMDALSGSDTEQMQLCWEAWRCFR